MRRVNSSDTRDENRSLFNRMTAAGLFLLLMSLAAAGNVHAYPWTATTINVGNIPATVVDPTNTSTLYAVMSWLGVAKSTNGAGLWSFGGSMTDLNVMSLAVDPNNTAILYAGTASGVEKSTNGAGSWTSVVSISQVRALAVDPGDSNVVYAGSFYTGMYKSTDAGATWASVNVGLGNLKIQSLIVNPVTTTIVYAGTKGGVYKSTDAGATWADANSGLGNGVVYALGMDPSAPDTLYAGTAGGVYKSTDGGGTWTGVSTGLTDTDVRSLSITSTILYAGTSSGGVFMSRDNGENWGAVNNDLTRLKVESLAADPANPAIVYAGCVGSGYGQVFKAIDPDMEPAVANAVSDVTENGGAASLDIDLTDVFTDGDDEDASITKAVESNSNIDIVTASISGNTLTLAFQPGQSGSADIVIRATSDGQTVDDTFTVTVDSTPSVAAAISDVTVDEDAVDTVIDLAAVFTDSDNDDASITKAVESNSNSTLVIAGISGNTLTLDFQADQSGSADIVIRGTSNGLFVDDTFTVTVDPVDDEPTVANAVSDVTVDEDAPDTVIDLAAVFTDPDVDDASITKTVVSNSNIDIVSASISGNTLTLDFQDNQSGSADIVIRGASNGENVNDTFTVTVNPVDDAPVAANTLNDVTVAQDAPDTVIDLAAVFTDPDSDDASITKAVESNSNSSLVAADISGNALTLDFQAGQSGTADIVVRATSNGLTVDDAFTVTVNAPVVPVVNSGGGGGGGGNVPVAVTPDPQPEPDPVDPADPADPVDPVNPVDPALPVVISDNQDNAGNTLADATINDGATLTGGEVAGNITNNGTLADVTIQSGATVTGGTFSGTIKNSGKIVGASLAKNAKINGGSVTGTITGKHYGPAVIKADIGKNAQLTHVVIAVGSTIHTGATLGAGVKFAANGTIPAGRNLTPQLGQVGAMPGGMTAQPAVNLMDDVLAGTGTASILDDINALPLLSDNGFTMTQDPASGVVEITLAGGRLCLVPTIVRQADMTTATSGVFLNGDGSVTMITPKGREITFQPMVASPVEFSDLLAAAGIYTGYTYDAGTISAAVNLTTQFLLRPGFKVSPVAQAASLQQAPPYLTATTSNDLPGFTFFSMVFTENGEMLEQVFYPAAADADALVSMLATLPGAENVNITYQGVVQVSIDGTIFSGLLDYFVNQANATGSAGNMEILSAGDMNGDGTDDLTLVYPNGDQQLLYLIP